MDVIARLEVELDYNDVAGQQFGHKTTGSLPTYMYVYMYVCVFMFIELCSEVIQTRSEKKVFIEYKASENSHSK